MTSLRYPLFSNSPFFILLLILGFTTCPSSFLLPILFASVFDQRPAALSYHLIICSPTLSPSLAALPSPPGKDRSAAMLKCIRIHTISRILCPALKAALTWCSLDLGVDHFKIIAEVLKRIFSQIVYQNIHCILSPSSPTQAVEPDPAWSRSSFGDLIGVT